MFAQDRSAEQPVGSFFGDTENRWRAGLRRFRRGRTRIRLGLALIGRGLADMAAGAPAVTVVAGALLLVWLARRVTLVRMGLNWLSRAHGGFLAALRACARGMAGASKAMAGGLAAAGLVLLLSPALGALADVLAALTERLPDLRLELPSPPPLPELPERPELDPSALRDALGALATRALFVVFLLGLTVTVAMTAAFAVAYAAFGLYVAVRGLGLAIAAVVAGLWTLLRASAGLVASAVLGVARGLSAVGRSMAAAAVWAATALRRLVVWLVVLPGRILSWAVVGGARALSRTAAGGYHAAGAAGRRGGRLLARLATAVLALLWRGALLIWANVFRLFALTGSIAAITFTVWAVRSMQRGEPLPRSLAELAASTALAAAALLAVTSALAILAAIAFAVRRAPPRLVRAVGLAALILLALAPAPLALRALWESAPAQALRDEAPELIAAAVEHAPVIGLAAVVTLTAIAAVVALVILVRRMSREAWRLVGRAVSLLAIVGAAALVIVWLATVLPWDAAAQSARATIDGVAALAASASRIVILSAASFAALALALWLLARTPARLKRAAAVTVLALAVAGALSYAWVAGWIDPSAAWAEARARWAAMHRPEPDGAGADDESDEADLASSTGNDSADTWAALRARWAQAHPAAPDATASDETDGATHPPARQAEAKASDLEPDAARPPIEATIVFPLARDLYWRFGRADLVGDGLTAFAPVDQAMADLDVCDAGAIVAVGMASSEGPAALNARLAQCRANTLARVARERARECGREVPVRVFALSLGQAASGRDVSADRRALVLALESAAGLDDEGKELDRTVASPSHSGRWRLTELEADVDVSHACEGLPSRR